MTDALRAAYEAIPYDSKPITLSFPPSLEAVARVHNMDPPPSDRARILELGCASGGNIIPLAEQFPDAEIVGIDLTPGQIAVGQQLIDALGLTNITLSATSISDVDDGWGVFDYILCHGVYSWVPPEVQDAILRISSRNLAPNGLAYISYNTYPGWSLRGMIREMLVRNDDRSLPAEQRVRRARDFLERIVALTHQRATGYTVALAEELTLLRSQNDAYVLHEQLEPYNSPAYFTDFAARAADHGLGYVAEAKLGSSTSRPAAWMSDFVPDLNDVVRVQQHMDLVRGRAFRRSVLCHASNERTPWPVADQIHRLHFGLNAMIVEPDAETVKEAGTPVMAFESAEGSRVTTNNPFIIGAMHTLSHSAPSLASFDDIADRVTELEAEAGRGDDHPRAVVAERLSPMLLECAIAGIVEAYGQPLLRRTNAFVAPRASGVARVWAGRGSRVPTGRHYYVELSDSERFLLRALDGTKTREQLVSLVTQALATQTLGADLAGVVVDPIAFVDDTLGRLTSQGIVLV